LNATKDFWYGKFSEVSVEVSVEDMDNNPLHYCHVRKCGVRQIPNAGGGKTRDAMITSVTMWRNPVEVASRMVQNLPQMT